MAALHTEQLEFLLSNLVQLPARTEVAGVFPADLPPPKRRLNARDVCFILNTDPRGAPGAHWLAFYYDAAKQQLEYFDSFGLPLSFFRTVAQFLASRKLRIIPANTHGMLQAIDTTACGYYCVLYLHYRARFGSSIGAASKIARLARTQNTRDAAVVRTVHTLMHKHHCMNMPSVTACTRNSQQCKCYGDCQRM